MTTPKHLTRRSLLGYGLGSAVLAACGGRRNASDGGRTLTPTPGVDDGDDHPVARAADAGTCSEPTADNIEGPYYKAGAPHQATLVRAGDGGDRLMLGGLVLAEDCAPLRDVELDIWHADHKGGYDLDTYHFRGKVTTDADGRWEVSTVIPGRYLNGRVYRPAHIHVMVRAAGHRELTTQLYFEGDPYNDGDPFIVSSLIMPLAKSGDVTRTRFDFVLAQS